MGEPPLRNGVTGLPAAREQRLQVLSAPLPQIGARASHNHEQLTSAALGFKALRIFRRPATIGPFGYGTVAAGVPLDRYAARVPVRLTVKTSGEC